MTNHQIQITKPSSRKLNILVTAGPTREPIDPVRFISNYATGFLGYALAREAARRGHRVILVSGPTGLARPKGAGLVEFVEIETAGELQQALQSRFKWCDCLVMTAAVGDFRVKQVARQKMKRAAGKGVILRLKQNPDILRGLALKRDQQMLVGFALETEALERNARNKLLQKRLDLIVASRIQPQRAPFGPVKLDALILDKAGRSRRMNRVSKGRLSGILLDRIEKDIL